jgi:hypothetical protein
MGERLRMRLAVHYQDDRVTDTVDVGQRELAEWERQPFGCASTVMHERAPMLCLRFCAWSGMRRRGLKQGFEAWNDLVDEVETLDDDAGGADPTIAGRPAGG